MKATIQSTILILLIIAGCFGCKNSNVYSRGETPPWYLEDDTDIHCSNVSEEGAQECFT